jgi:hypothetical protein
MTQNPERGAQIPLETNRKDAAQSCQEWYCRSDVRQALISQLREDREVWVNAEDYASPRPRVAKSPSDLLQLIPKGRVCSVSSSIERFSDPLLLTTEEPNTLRLGWDLILDIDSDNGFEAAKRCSQAVIRLLANYDLESVKVKFSGRRGYHLLIEGEAFDCFSGPTDFLRAYPLVPLQVARFITAALSPKDRRGVEIDTAVYSPRHLIRIAYSLHHLTKLVSLPLSTGELGRFTLEDASPDRIKQINWNWLDTKPKLGEASTLLDYVVKWVQRSKPRTGIHVLSRANAAKTRTHDSTPCVSALMREGFSAKLEGHRHDVLCNVLNGIRRLGFTITPEQLKELNKRSEKPLPERELEYQIRYQLSRPRPYRFKPEIMQEAGLCPSIGCRLCRNPPFTIKRTDQRGEAYDK